MNGTKIQALGNDIRTYKSLEFQVNTTVVLLAARTDMTTVKASCWKFGWKRKLGEKVSKEASDTFSNDTEDEKSEGISNEEIDWLTLVPVRKNICLEDAKGKSSRLKEEGTVLAESERYWEAIKKWDEAIHLTPNDEKLYEMKAQALLQLCEVYPAVHMAQKAVHLKPNWWIGLQTLGRAQLGLGEVHLALKSFSRACHLKPDESELWEDDLIWARTLVKRKQKMDEDQQKTEEQSSGGVTITEINDDDDENIEKCECRNENDMTTSVVKRQFITHTTRRRKHKTDDLNSDDLLNSLPKDYVQMRNYTDRSAAWSSHPS